MPSLSGIVVNFSFLVALPMGHRSVYVHAFMYTCTLVPVSFGIAYHTVFEPVTLCAHRVEGVERLCTFTK